MGEGKRRCVGQTEKRWGRGNCGVDIKVNKEIKFEKIKYKPHVVNKVKSKI